MLIARVMVANATFSNKRTYQQKWWSILINMQSATGLVRKESAKKLTNRVALIAESCVSHHNPSDQHIKKTLEKL
jgi:hypothetical protein